MTEQTLAIDEQGYMDVGGAVLPIHRNTVHQATTIDETGDRYSLIEWDHRGNTDRIYGESTPTSRVVELAEGVRAYQTKGGDLGFRSEAGEKAALAEEMLDHGGRLLDDALGKTRKRGIEESVEASEVLERLEEFWEE